MSSDSKIDNALRRISGDSRVSIWHIGLYPAILHRWHENDFIMPFNISRRQLMELAHIGSIATYHKCIKQLIDFGYISYYPSYNPNMETKIFLKVD